MSDFDITLDRRGTRAGAATLVEQLVRAVRQAIGEGALRPGSRLPSVRELARAQRLSTFTVLEAYGRLVSMGLIVARRGAGYRVGFDGGVGQGAVHHKMAAGGAPRARPGMWEPPALNAGWLLSDVYADHSVPVKAGCGWLPGEWVNEGGMRHALRAIGRVPGARLADYGQPFGFAPLRERIAAQLDQHGLPIASNANVLLTHGATQALDLVVRTLLRVGDTVVVEDPCYCNLLPILRLAGLRVVGVPRTLAGIDNDALERLIAAHRPTALFLNTTLHNPTGATFGMASAFRVLQIAERHGMWVIEDDVSRALAPAGAPLLAALEGLRRVVYVGGFAKSIVPALRCGYVVAEQAVLRELARTKMAVGLTSSEIGERIVEKVIAEGRYARHLDIVTERLRQDHARLEARMDAHGIALFHRPRAGLFVWGRLPIDPDAAIATATHALRDGIWLAPGSYFRPDGTPSAWFRFNVPHSLDDALWRFITRLPITSSDSVDARP